ncbi:MAG: tRNA (adenosine(37)-N6)-threonylcarbamoyltransferase complex transferase subunit TsaD [Gammaproteobacteria bacterium]
MTTILALETSCDETAAAVYVRGRGIVGEHVRGQSARHKPFGGVVPELAARDHLRAVLPMVDALMKHTGAKPSHIAYTAGPGLAGALFAGAAFACALAFARGLPPVAVNHLEGHLLSPLLAEPHLAFPYTALLISGGHTQLWRAAAPRKYQLLGATMDDSAGEALDKTALLLGAGINGADLERLATFGDARRFKLPSPAQRDLQFSFSGIKTAARRLRQKHPQSNADIAAVMQFAVADGLAKQARQALMQTGDKVFAAVGGVAQNQTVKAALNKAAQQSGARCITPHARHCGDNAAMIALAADTIIKENPPPKDYAFRINPRWQPGGRL